MAQSSTSEAIRQTLEAKRRELAETANHEGIRVIRDAGEIDDVELAVERETATAHLERRSMLIRQIADALVRLGNGEYGSCVRCGGEIPAARLHAVPWTPHCLRCQEVAEREHRDSNPALTVQGAGEQSATLRFGRDPR